MNSERQYIDVKHSKDIQIISMLQDSQRISLLGNEIHVKRSSNPIHIQYLNHKDTFTRALEPFLSNTFWWNIYFNYGLGMFADHYSDKKYSYLKSFYITEDNQIVKQKKGNYILTLGSEFATYSDKEFTAFSIMPYNLNIGVEYYHVHNQFMSGEYNIGLFIGNTNSSQYFRGYLANTFNLNNNHVFNNFEIGYGLSFRQSPYENGIGWNVSGTNMLSKSFGLNLNVNCYTFNLNNADAYLMPSFRFKILFKIPLKN